MDLPRRISAGAATLIFFAMFFALPLFAAATMCAMPCCHDSRPGPKLKSNLLNCPGNECVITADDATVKAVSRYVVPAPAAIAHVSAPIVAVTAEKETFAAVSPPRNAPPLHLLKTTVRI